MERALVWLRNAVITVGMIAWQAAVSLRYNWGIGILSVVLAISFWVYVTDRENPEQTGPVPGAVPIEAINVPAGQAVFSISPESVTVRARASKSVFERLTAEDFRATADLSDVAEREATVKVRVQSQESRAEVVDFSPAEITVTLENVTSRTVPVHVRELGGLPRGFRLGAVELDVEEAVVTGPERLVGDVAVVQADVNLTGADAGFEQRVTLQARAEGGTPIPDVKVEPESAVVQVEIIQLEFSAVFVVLPDVRGTPAAGYRATAVQVDPPFVVISGPAEVFGSIDPVEGIMTDAVSIDGASADVVRTVALRLPPGARVGQAGVTVRIIIERTSIDSATPTKEG